MKESTSFQETTHSQEGGSEEATRSLELGKEPGCKQTGWCGGGRCNGPAVARLSVVLRMGAGAIARWREGRAVGSLEGVLGPQWAPSPRWQEWRPSGGLAGGGLGPWWPPAGLCGAGADLCSLPSVHGLHRGAPFHALPGLQHTHPGHQVRLAGAGSGAA